MKKHTAAIRWISLALFTVSLLITMDLLLNYRASQMPPPEGGFVPTSFFHRLMGLFGMEFTQMDYYNAYSLSAWVTAMLAIENMGLALWGLWHPQD